MQEKKWPPSAASAGNATEPRAGVKFRESAEREPGGLFCGTASAFPR